MRKVVACALFALVFGTAAERGSVQQPSLTLVGARVYADPDAPAIDDAVVVVQDGVVTAVGARTTTAIPAGTTTIECKGLTVTAGFYNNHVHFTDPKRWNDAGSTAAERLTIDLREMLTRFGYTTVVDTASDLENTLALRRRIEEGEVSGPRILTAGGALYPPAGVPFYVRDDVSPEVLTRLHQPATPTEAGDNVRRQAEKGADLVKIFAGSWVSRERVLPMPAMVARAAVEAAHARGQLVFAHPSNVAGLDVALQAGVDVLAHALDDTRGLTAAHYARLKRQDIAMVPTLALFRGRWLWDILDEVRTHARGGGDVLFGTDVGYLPNFDHTVEYELMASAGLGWRATLASLTTAPARRFNEASRRGKVQTGMQADLVVLGTDPALGARGFTDVRYTIRAGRIIFERPAASQESAARVDMRVAVAPTPFKGSDGQTHLAYELVVNDIPRVGARIDRVEVFGEPDAKPLVTYAEADLNGRVMRPEADPKVRYGRVVPSGTTALIHVWLTLAEDQLVPRTLRHSFRVSTEGGEGLLAGDARIDVHASAPAIVGSPFGAGAWLVHNGPGQHQSAHWGSALVDQRTARIPQRYAIDFIGVDDMGRAVRGDFRKSSNDDWIGFGREVLAGVEGAVYAAYDGIVDNRPLAELPRPSSPSAEHTYGNYVIIKAVDGTFVHYAHLQRNTVSVKPGKAVRRGQVIGRVGNSGNTNGAHLHFNITAGPAPEATQGVPFVFDSVDVLGRTTAATVLGAEPSAGQTQASSMRQQRTLPLDGTIVRFR
jgi:imidazolonepropionase-like amidohydrolase